jgi:hypothetical protein
MKYGIMNTGAMDRIIDYAATLQVYATDVEIDIFSCVLDGLRHEKCRATLEEIFEICIRVKRRIKEMQALKNKATAVIKY